MSELDRLTRELVKQIVGRNVDDVQDGDYQIAYRYLFKAMKLGEQSGVNRRELLLTYHKYLDSLNDPMVYNASEGMIDDYLDNNCS